MEHSLSLYLHIPFCRHRCAYCDFNTYTSLADLKPAYTDALCQEIRQVAGDKRRRAHTVFFGGGTPSLIASGRLAQLLTVVNQFFELSSNAEISLEANPGTVNADYLDELRQCGFNRISFGAQSADDGELTLLEREHIFDDVVEAVELSRRAGFDNLNLDLIYGLPDQSLASWRRTLEAALRLDPEHLSLYCLTIEPGTPMQQWLDAGKISVPNPDLAADQYELACDLLSQAGYEHYEISNWAKPDYACRHNLTYWRNGAYLGFGAGAHGHAANIRYQIVKQPRVYIRRIIAGNPASFPLSSAVAHYDILQPEEMMSDTMITQLRLLQEGLDLADFRQKYGKAVEDAYFGTVPQMLEWGLLQKKGGKLLLTQRGTLVSNQLFYRFV